MGFKIYQVDAFTRVPFKGNPAAVCLLDAPRPEEWMQQVAAEMNLPVTEYTRLLEEVRGASLLSLDQAVSVDDEHDLAGLSELIEDDAAIGALG